MLDALDAIDRLEDPPTAATDILDLIAQGISEEDMQPSGYIRCCRGSLASTDRDGTPTPATRGLDTFTRHIYVETKIAASCGRRIERGEFRLVVITGNAGDGKTAFILTLERPRRVRRGRR
jgi:hypothetical protein